MNKTIISVAGLIILAGSLTACGAGAVKVPTTISGNTSTLPGASATNGATQKPASGGLSWGDVPIYPGAKLTQSGQAGAMPGSGMTKIEARYYETSDSADKVEAFCKAQLPLNGWQSQGWTEIGMMNGAYVNADQTATLLISILPPGPGGKTVITITKGTK